MNRAKLLRLSIRLANSLSSTRSLGFHRLISTQVNHLSLPFHSSVPAICSNSYTGYNLLNLHKKLFFSSKTQSFIDLVSKSDAWSQELETELENLDPKLTYESVVFALVKLKETPKKSLDFFNWVCVKKGFEPRVVHYGLLLRCLACKEFMEDFWVIASKLKEKWVYYDNNVYATVFEKLKHQKLMEESDKWTKLFRTTSVVANDVAKEVVDLIVVSDWSKELEDLLMEKLTFPLPEYLLVRIVMELSRKPLAALKFFEWIGSSGGYEHDSVTYNVMAKVLAKDESVSEFWDFVKQMRGDGYEMDIDTYVRSSRQLSSKDAVELFEFMMDGPYKPSLQDCTALLQDMSRDSDLDSDLATRVVKKFTAAGNTLSESVIVGVHRALCTAGKLDEAKKIVETLKKAGFEPDNVTYSQEVFGLCKQRKLKEACQVLEQMEAEGCVPDVITWTILLDGFCRAKQVDQAISYIAKMKEKNVHPDAKTLHVLLLGFISENRLMDAYNFLIEMVNKDNLKPSRMTFKLMIEKLAKDGMFDEALDLLILMMKLGYEPDPELITQSVSETETVEDAKKLLLARFQKVSPSTATYIHLIRSFFQKGRYSEANALLEISPIDVKRAKTIKKMFDSKKDAQLERTPALAKNTIVN